MYNIIALSLLILLTACSGSDSIFDPSYSETDNDTTSMCYKEEGNTLSLWCYSINPCSADNLNFLESYSTWDNCYADMNNVLNNYSNTGEITPGGSSGGSGGGSCDLNDIWSGPDELQIYSQCQAACAYNATGNSEGVNATCEIIAQWGYPSSCIFCN